MRKKLLKSSKRRVHKPLLECLKRAFPDPQTKIGENMMEIYPSNGLALWFVLTVILAVSLVYQFIAWKIGRRGK